ncbi:lipoate--protein ligase [Clostridium ihumii]|uniref:lipoate--protein ligase n=1 Tax=Clostridium ihumii TaxID=1470356 RepID=UPI00058E37CB|nr:lipoate--protein ligase [Clostridium ihumii]
MLFINHNNINPYFNHAAEEYVLKNFDDECFMLWRNSPCILIGKNQNAFAEINTDYVKENNIIVVRRLTGGGAVFNDLGNINFTFISKNKGDINSNFRKFTLPILKALDSLGINASFSGRNDITIDGKKISGNAQYYYKDKVLHHGTLLFSSSISNLSEALKVNPLKIKSKGVNSVSARVTNIHNYLNTDMDVLQFKNYITSFVMDYFNEKNLYNFTDYDLKNINIIMEDRFSKFSWNFGRNPEYEFRKEIRFKGGTIEVNFNVVNGYINDLKFYGDFFFKDNISKLEKNFLNIKHDFNNINCLLDKIDVQAYINDMEKEDLLELLF